MKSRKEWIPLVTALVCLSAVARAQDTIVYAADRILMSDGTWLASGRVAVSDGKIVSVGAASESTPAPGAVELTGWLTPGLIAGRSYAGAAQESHDDTRAIIEDARMVDAFDPAHSDFGRAVRAGITALVLAPQPGNLAGGLTAVVKTHGGRVLADQAQLALSFAGAALTPMRKPTSASGAVDRLAERFKAPRGGPFALAAAARLPVLIAADSRDELQRALSFAAEWNLTGALVGATEAGQLTQAIQQSKFGVVMRPLSLGTPARVLAGLVELEQRQVPLAFAVDAPAFDPLALRISAALGVRAGLSERAALRALTADAAKLSGVGERVGSLSKGLDADLVLWSGSPIDLTSRVLAVWIDGQRIELFDQGDQAWK